MSIRISSDEEFVAPTSLAFDKKSSDRRDEELRKAQRPNLSKLSNLTSLMEAMTQRNKMKKTDETMNWRWYGLEVEAFIIVLCKLSLD